MNSNTLKPARSVKLEEPVLAKLREHVGLFPTQVEAAISLKIDRVVLSRVMTYGSGSEKTVTKIKEALGC